MHSLITSYLLQSKECVLPGIGLLKIIRTPASVETKLKSIEPPFDGIIFKNQDHLKSPGLVKYIADRNNIQIKEAERQLNKFCKEWREKLNAGEKLNFETIGSIHRNDEGIITFEGGSSFNFLRPIPLNGKYIIQRKAISTDNVLGFPEAKQLRQDLVIERSYWSIWALILLAIGIVMICYHFIDNRSLESIIGNRRGVTIDSATSTYKIPK